MNKVVDFTDQIADRVLDEAFMSPALLEASLYGRDAGLRAAARNDLIVAAVRWAAREGYNLASGVNS